MEKAELIQEIKEAFADTAYPGDAMTYDYYSTPYPGDYEGDQIADAFKGLTWEKVPRKLLIEHRGHVTSFFTPKALAYYMPSFMIFLIEDYEEADVMSDTIVWALTPPEPHVLAAQIKQAKDIMDFDKQHPELSFPKFSESHAKHLRSLEQQNPDEVQKDHEDRFNDLVSCFSSSQKKVIAEFLAYFSQEHEQDPTVIKLDLDAARKALDRYWKQFLPK